MYTCPLMFIICIIWAFRMSLMMEMGALALGSGAVVGGVFGMNLVSGLEEHPQGEFNKPMSRLQTTSRNF